MPFATLKVPAGLIDAATKQRLVDQVTDMYAELCGDGARPTTMVLIEEVADGGWGIGGRVLTSAMLKSADTGSDSGTVPGAGTADGRAD